jgi:diguanylate cyclase (GGDEF)-like protein
MKKIGLIFWALIALVLFSNSEIQDLEKQLETLSGKKRISALVRLAEYYQQNDAQKSLQYATQILDLAAKTESDKERALANKISGKYYLEQKNYVKAQEYFIKALFISEEKQFEKEIAENAYYLGFMHYKLNHFTEALDSFTKALPYYKKVKDAAGESNTLNYLGLIHWRWNKFSKSLEYHQNSLLLKETLQDTLGIANTLTYIGNVYIQLNHFDDALENYNKSLIIFDKLNHKKGTAEVFLNIGSIYYYQDDMDKALDYYIRSLKIHESLHDEKGIADCFNNIGKVYQKQKSYRLANDYFLQAQKKFIELNDMHGMASSITNMGMNDFLEKKYDVAIRKANESNEISKKDNNHKITMENYDLLSRVYAARGDFKNALQFFQKYDEIKDEFFKEELRKMTEIKIDYETLQKDRQIDNLQRERQIIELQLAAQTANLRTLLILFIVSFVLLIVILHRYLHYKKAQKALVKQTEQLKAVAKTDTLTKISNKSDLMEHLEMEQKRFARNQKSFVIMIADLDDFTRINEQYGPEAGDFVLRTFSHSIRSSIRRHDILGRWGGQQFLMILPETDLQGGQIISEKIRKRIATNPLSFKNMNIYITVTIGLTIYNKQVDMETCIAKAETALETGKNRGKNCVIISTV